MKPSGRSFQKLWEEMRPDQRGLAVQHFWRDGQDIKLSERDCAISAIAQARKSRTSSIKKADPTLLEKWTLALQGVPSTIASALIRQYLLHDHREMIKSCLDDLKIPNVAGVMAPGFDAGVVDSNLVDAGIEKLRARFDNDAVQLYLEYVSLNDDEWADAVREALGRTSQEKLDESSTGTVGSLLANDDGLLTNLDLLIERAIANTVAGSPGSLDSDQLRDVVDEILQNNPHRTKTYFHKGYLDGSVDNCVDPHFRGENRDRRLWYLAGAIRALDDRGDRKAILDLFEKADLKDLGQEQSQRSVFAAAPVFKALCQDGKIPAAVAFITPQSIFHCGLFEWGLEFGTRLLRSQEISSALKIFELLQSAVDALTKDQEFSLGDRVFDLKRRHAHCLRMQRHFGAAIRILERLLMDPNAPERSAMAVDVALMRAGFRGLLDVIIPEHEPHRFVQRLEQLRPVLEEALEVDGDTAHAAYCLGVLGLAQQREPSRAAELLDRSVTNILRHANEYDVGGLLNRARFYLGLARAEALDHDFVEKASALFQESIKAGFVPWDHLLKRYIDALSILGPSPAVRAAETAVNKLGASRVLDSVLDTEVASKSQSILSKLLEYAQNDARPGKRRFSDLRRILKHAINGDYLDLAAEALDGMERLAKEDICIAELLDLLERDENYHPAWSKSDADRLAAGLFERTGKLAQARYLLEQDCYRILADKPWDFTDQIEDLLVKISELGASTEEIQPLREHLAAIDTTSLAPVAEENVLGIHVRVVVVGGDERQADFDRAIRDYATAELGPVTLEFRHTGWSGNWGHRFDEMRTTLDSADVVIVLRLIRTNLGRKVRAHVKRWVGCAGNSKSSIERAIAFGVEMVRREA